MKVALSGVVVVDVIGALVSSGVDDGADCGAGVIPTAVIDSDSDATRVRETAEGSRATLRANLGGRWRVDV